MQRRFLYIPDLTLKNGKRCREIWSEKPSERGSSLLSSFLLRCAIQSDRNTCTTLHIKLTLKQWTTNNKVLSFLVDSVECGRYVKVLVALRDCGLRIERCFLSTSWLMNRQVVVFRDGHGIQSRWESRIYYSRDSQPLFYCTRNFKTNMNVDKMKCKMPVILRQSWGL